MTLAQYYIDISVCCCYYLKSAQVGSNGYTQMPNILKYTLTTCLFLINPIIPNPTTTTTKNLYMFK
jgi:hypothetical protein